MPEAASFNEDDGVWELGPRKGTTRHGSFTTWRTDGSKKGELRYKEGTLHGPFRIYHESGDLAREGAYRNGELHGVVVVLTTGGRTSEPAFDGAGPGVARTEVEYAQGRMISVRHFDKDRNRVSPDGEPLPELPRGVPSLAAFEPTQRRWVHGPVDGEGRRSGLWMWWTEDGTLIEESEFRDGRRDGVCRRYAASGRLIEEGAFADDQMNGTWSFYDPDDGHLLRKADYDEGKFHGSVVDYGKDGRSRTRVEYDGGRKTGQFLARVDKGKYAGGKIRVETGQYKDDVPVGRWKLLDKGLKPEATIDFGVLRAEGREIAPELVDDAPRDEAHWLALVDRLKEERHIGESLLASARAAAESGSPVLLKERLATECAPLSESWSRTLADDTITRSGDALGPLAHALVGGAHPVRVLEACALILDRQKATRAARDFVEAARLLAPDDERLPRTRGLILLALGEAARARADAAAIATTDADTARFLTTSVDALFPSFTFWPDEHALDRGASRRAVALVRDLPQILRLIQKHATRYEILRRRALTHADGIPSWSPPDASPLLPVGELDLVRDTVDGDELDETVPETARDLLATMAWLRASYAALCWLSWTTGASRPTLARALRTPREFSPMAHQWMERAELLADPAQAPSGFTYAGHDVEELSSLAREVARLEHAEVALVFTWLSDPNLASPFVVTRRPPPPILSG